MLLAYLDKRLERKEKRGVALGRKRLFILTYADLVLLAREEGDMRLMGKQEEYLKGKELEINAENFKIMRFGKRIEKEKKGVEMEEG